MKEYPAVSTQFEKYPFLARCGLVCTGLIKTITDWRLNQLAVVVHDEKTTSDVKPTNGPYPIKRDQHTCVISKPQGLVWLLLHTVHDET